MFAGVKPFTLSNRLCSAFLAACVAAAAASFTPAGSFSSAFCWKIAGTLTSVDVAAAFTFVKASCAFGGTGIDGSTGTGAPG